MSTNQMNYGQRQHHAEAALRVHRVKGDCDEYFVRGGTTIGRSIASDIQLESDKSVERVHARVEGDMDGRLWLCTTSGAAGLTLGEATVQRVELLPGVTFWVGRTQITCLNLGSPADEHSTNSVCLVCPLCNKSGFSAVETGPKHCPDCSRLVYVQQTSARTEAVVVPGAFGEFQVTHVIEQTAAGITLRGIRPSNSERIIIEWLPEFSGWIADNDADFCELVNLRRGVNHPNVLPLYDSGQVAGRWFFIWECPDGYSLEEVTRDYKDLNSRPPLDDALNWVSAACEGLVALESAGIIPITVRKSSIWVAPGNRVLFGEMLAFGGDSEAPQEPTVPRRWVSTAHAAKTEAYSQLVHAFESTAWNVMTGGQGSDGVNGLRTLLARLTPTGGMRDQTRLKALAESFSAIVHSPECHL